jgi:hypothetical protein
MKKIFAVALLLGAGVAHAGLPPGMPATASAMTSRDDCFQTLRGHVDQSARKSGFQVLRMIEGYGAEMANGDFQCMAKFAVGSPEKWDETNWHEQVIFAHQQPSGECEPGSMKKTPDGATAVCSYGNIWKQEGAAAK